MTDVRLNKKATSNNIQMCYLWKDILDTKIQSKSMEKNVLCKYLFKNNIER